VVVQPISCLLETDPFSASPADCLSVSKSDTTYKGTEVQDWFDAMRFLALRSMIWIGAFKEESPWLRQR